MGKSGGFNPVLKGMALGLAAAISVFVSGCGTEQVKYRPMSGYESSKKHFCTVKDELFTPDANSTAAEYGVKTYYFCCAKCESIFMENTGKYLIVENEEPKHESKSSHGSSGGSCH